MWDLPRPGLEPVSPALAGRLSTTAPPGKPLGVILYFLFFLRSHIQLVLSALPYLSICLISNLSVLLIPSFMSYLDCYKNFLSWFPCSLPSNSSFAMQESNLSSKTCIRTWHSLKYNLPLIPIAFRIKSKFLIMAFKALCKLDYAHLFKYFSHHASTFSTHSGLLSTPLIHILP